MKDNFNLSEWFVEQYKVNANISEEFRKEYGEKISKQAFADLKDQEVTYIGKRYKVEDADGFGLKLQALDNPAIKIKVNLNQFNEKGFIHEMVESIRLGYNLDESKLCKRGRDYIAARKRAGEKSSAYLSGRAVKVCKGQIKGAGGKRKKSYKSKK